MLLVKFPHFWRIPVTGENLYPDLVWLWFAVSLKMKRDVYAVSLRPEKQRKEGWLSLSHIFLNTTKRSLPAVSFSAQGSRGCAMNCSVKWLYQTLSNSPSHLQLSYLQQCYSRDRFHLQYRAVQFIHPRQP